MSGWNLPPGCSVADIERAAGGDRDLLPFEEAVLTALEDADVPTHVNDKIMAILDEYIRSLDEWDGKAQAAYHGLDA